MRGYVPIEHTGQSGRLRVFVGGADCHPGFIKEILIWVEVGVNKSVDSHDFVHENGDVNRGYIFQTKCFLSLQKEYILNQTLGFLS